MVTLASRQELPWSLLRLHIATSAESISRSTPASAPCMRYRKVIAATIPPKDAHAEPSYSRANAIEFESAK